MYSKEIIQKVHPTLPQELLEIIASDETLENINSIASAHQLVMNRADKLSSLISYRIMGLITDNDFQHKLEEELLVDSEKSLKIKKEVEERILGNIPKSILENQEKNTQSLLEKLDSSEPIVITTKTKEEALEELSRREEIKKQEVPEKPAVPPASAQGSSMAMEIAPSNLPAVEPSEIAHEVPHVEQKVDPPSPKASEGQGKKPLVSTPNYSYESGKDPYREPL